MFYFKLIFKNVFRAKLRSSLTITGLVIAIVAFGLLQTVVDAWFAGSNAASASRLVTRNSISLVFPMPIYYRERMRAVNGVKAVTLLNWFGGIYKEPPIFQPNSSASFLPTAAPCRSRLKALSWSVGMMYSG